MKNHEFDYQCEKFSVARSSLMLPHPMGEERSLADAFHACSLGLRGSVVGRVHDQSARGWIRTIERFVNTEGVEDPTGDGKWVQRARSMTTDEKREFAYAVDQIAHWFDRQFWVGE